MGLLGLFTSLGMDNGHVVAILFASPKVSPCQRSGKDDKQFLPLDRNLVRQPLVRLPIVVKLILLVVLSTAMGPRGISPSGMRLLGLDL